MADPAPTRIREPEIDAETAADGTRTVRLGGAWDIRALEVRARALGGELARFAARDAWDLSGVQRLDHVGALLLWRAWARKRPDLIRMAPAHELFFENLAHADGEARSAPRRSLLDPLAALGSRAIGVWGHLVRIVRLAGQVVLDGAWVIANPSRGPWRELSATIYRAGAQALPITALVGFLIGIVLSYLSAEQLRTFGAGIYVINIVGIGIIRELGPVLAAILVAGRSGSAITAQLGVMRVTEELDALRVMGIPAGIRLILPKVVGLAIAVPLLVVWTSAIALIGAMLAARLELDISFALFLQTLPVAVPTANLWLALVKGAVFGALIALTACHYGLRIRPNTESLGAGTTQSVVTAITIVLIVDSLFAVAFSHIGLELRG
ncbi:MAG: ABC transporter permease [Burkholderiales bacterium]|nr:ABC transporter permease [Burkholderiales bacterium]